MLSKLDKIMNIKLIVLFVFLLNFEANAQFTNSHALAFCGYWEEDKSLKRFNYDGAICSYYKQYNYQEYINIVRTLRMTLGTPSSLDETGVAWINNDGYVIMFLKSNNTLVHSLIKVHKR